MRQRRPLSLMNPGASSTRETLRRRPDSNHPTWTRTKVLLAFGSHLKREVLSLFMVIAAMTCGPELAPESSFANGVREKLLAPG
jgi:hypothetical protein